MKGTYKLLLISFLLLIVLTACSNVEEAGKKAAPNQMEAPSKSEITNGTTFGFGTSLAALVKEFGKPNEDFYYLGGRLIRFENEGYFLDENERVSGMFVTDTKAEVHKVNVGMTLEEMTQIIGKPDEAYYDDGETQYYLMIYYVDDYKIIFSSVNEASPTEYALILSNNS